MVWSRTITRWKPSLKTYEKRYGDVYGVLFNPRTKKPFANARELLARGIRELRRVYPEIPNSLLQIK